MAISRMQMNRQLRAGGGIMDIAPREKFGLGSKLKKFVRKVIPNEVADVASKAAPFVAPFNPLLAGGMAAIGGFDKSGSLSDSIKRGILTYGGGQAARYLGGAGFQQGVNPFAGADFSQGIMSGLGSLGSSPIGIETGLKLGQYPIFGGPQAVPEGQYLPSDFATEALPLEQATSNLAQATGEVTKRTFTDISKDLFSGDFTKMGNAAKELGGKALKAVYTDKDGNLDKMAVAGTIAAGTSYLEAKKLAEEADLVDDADEYTEEMYEADKAMYADKYAQYLTPQAFGLKEGGRVKLQNGSGIPSIMLEKKDSKDYNFMELIDEDAEEEYYRKKADELDRKYNPQNYNDIIPKEKPLDQFMLNEIMGDKGMNTLSEEARDDAMKMYAERAFKKGQISEEEYKEIMGFKKGGRVGYKDAGFTTVEDLGIEREELGFPYDKSEYGLEDVDLLEEMPKVMVMDKEGKTRIVPEKVAERLGLKIIMDSYNTEKVSISRNEKKAKGGRVGFNVGGNKKLADYEREERITELEDLMDKLMTEEGIQDKGYAIRLAGDLIDMKNKGINSDRLKFLNEKSSLYALPTDMRPEPEYYDALKALQTRVNRKFGSPKDGEDGIMSITMKTEDDDKKLTGIETLQDEDRLAVFPKDVFSANEISRLFSDKSLTTNLERKQLYKILMNPGQFPDAEMGLKKLLGRPIEEFKKGGRVQYAMGSPEQNAMAASGISGIPLNVNPAGATELDMRNTGGFVPPVGVKEKADDIPAMLSNNEFVFTADAVRAAGGGSVNKGAKKMYNLMKSLEGKVV